MKRNWWRIGVAIAVVIGFGVLANVSTVKSAPDTAKITEGKPKPKASSGKKPKPKLKFKANANPCPAGWKKVAYEGPGMFTCKPKKPKKKKCPPNSEWFFKDCLCGCKHIVY